MGSDAHLTRRQRRAANGLPKAGIIAEIPFAQPDRSGPKDKSLLDIAREREAQLHEQIHPNSAGGSADAAAAVADGDVPLLDALLYGFTLTTLNLTLDILVWHQYAEAFQYSVLINRNATTTFPILVFVVWVFHSPWFGLARVEWLRQGIFFCVSVAAGMYAVLLSNDKAYLAVMKKAPPTGTIWVWAVMEMGAAGGALSLLIVGIWTWLNGYRIM